MISQGAPSRSAKCARRSPQAVSVGGRQGDALGAELRSRGVAMRQGRRQIPAWPARARYRLDHCAERVCDCGGGEQDQGHAIYLPSHSALQERLGEAFVSLPQQADDAPL